MVKFQPSKLAMRVRSPLPAHACLNQMLTLILNRIDAVVAYKLDRLGRSLPHLAQMIGEMTAHRVAVIIPAQGIDTRIQSGQPITTQYPDGGCRVRTGNHSRASELWIACSEGARCAAR